MWGEGENANANANAFVFAFSFAFVVTWTEHVADLLLSLAKTLTA